MGIWDKIKSSFRKERDKIEKSGSEKVAKAEKGWLGKTDRYLSEKFAYGAGKGPSASRKFMEAEEKAGRERRLSEKDNKRAARDARMSADAAKSKAAESKMQAAEVQKAWEAYSGWREEALVNKEKNLSSTQAKLAAGGMREGSFAWTSALKNVESDYEKEVAELQSGPTYGLLTDYHKKKAPRDTDMEDWYRKMWSNDTGIQGATSAAFGAQANIANTPVWQ